MHIIHIIEGYLIHSMYKSYLKNLLIIIGIVLIMVAVTFINQNYFKNSQNRFNDVYSNELSDKISKNDIDDVDYEYILKDLNSIDDILIEKVSLDIDKVKKTKYYSIAENVYSQKINEIVRVLNDILDDEDFYRLEQDLEEFQKNIDFAISDFKNTLESSVEFEFYKNKYLYEEKQKKCRDILETYKGFLQ